MPELEQESADHARVRRARRTRRLAAEFAFGFAFVALAHYAAHAAKTDGPQAAAPITAVALAALVLVGWLLMYVRWHRSYDEFERILELRAVALAAGAMVVLATVWGLATMILGAPSPPVVLVAPVFSGLYSAFRLLMSSGYR